MVPTTTMAVPCIPPTSKEAAKPQSSLLRSASSSWSSRVRKRRPSEIFDATFNFWAPSRRRIKYTPPLSPRTSSENLRHGTRAATPGEPCNKKQRVDSFSAKDTRLPTHHQDASEDGSDSAAITHIRLKDMATQVCPLAKNTDPHPGQPVDFSIPCYAGIQQEPPRRENHELYHTHPEEPFPGILSPTDDVSIIFTGTTKYCPPICEAEQDQGTESRIPWLSNTEPARHGSSTGCSRPPLRSSSSASTAAAATRSSDSSTYRFLSHVRASQEARRRRSTEDRSSIFADDDHDDNWLWGDRPL
ncbi:hypothetical protein ACEQ8H_000921 [Pleosporales sp. CAS-2024a]